MLDLRRVATALAAKRELFTGYGAAHGSALEGYRARWLEVSALPQAEVEARLAGVAGPGARPSAEHDRCRGPVVPFAPRWHTHEEARAWARQVLVGVPTIAVDGSQISPSKDFSLPVGAVQIGWFENHHDPAGSYVKDVAFEVLAPGELAIGDHGDDGFPDQMVNLHRFEGECRRLVACMEAYRGREPWPVCFFDGSLIVSFAQQMAPAHQARYVRAVTGLLTASQRTQVPLVGYVDTSYAADLAAMLDVIGQVRGERRVADAAFLHPLLTWGERTPAWICARDDRVAPLDGKYYEQVAFTYLQTTAGNPPARLEVPRWLVEAGRLEAVLDVVRAECVVGNGYPYAIETADAVAVITMQDRERFCAAFQRFAAQEGLPLRFSRKAGSKLGRR
ncbi:MAG TPA: DNA double-strand break repair nuclease NurA [Anaerolineae bacterium]|nr:DNA double-strand break repair nuclease NurA [Anaerolineae bacterium]HOQ98519.1 DNA double-strand break repair nuclease NurA [Anaerolineae bacterium]HOQ98526.1 DNA double-strand break repair nuclease NurA [Anaerolineae bacterium]HPL27189.1 DNA double-strand break repair nuclease NurA [Anaerolineae bacterium]